MNSQDTKGRHSPIFWHLKKTKIYIPPNASPKGFLWVIQTISLALKSVTFITTGSDGNRRNFNRSLFSTQALSTTWLQGSQRKGRGRRKWTGKKSPLHRMVESQKMKTLSRILLSLGLLVGRNLKRSHPLSSTQVWRQGRLELLPEKNHPSQGEATALYLTQPPPDQLRNRWVFCLWNFWIWLMSFEEDRGRNLQRSWGGCCIRDAIFKKPSCSEYKGA